MAIGGQCLWGTVVVIHLLHWHSFYKILSTALLTSAWRWDSLPIGACGSFGEAARPNALALAGRRLGFVAGLHVRSPKCSQAQILASVLYLPYVAFAVSVGLCICCSCSRHYLAACTCFATRPPNRVRDSMQVRFRSAIADGPPIQPEPPPAARPNALALAGRRLGFVEA